MNRRESQVVIFLVAITLVFLITSFGTTGGALSQERDQVGADSPDRLVIDRARGSKYAANGIGWEVFLPVIFANYTSPCVPTLLTPAEGATMDNGRVDGQDKVIWDFDWANCPGATEYHLFVVNVNATIPVVDDDAIASSEFHFEGGGYVAPGNLTGWLWKVRAKVGGTWGPWSPTRSFVVEPPDTDPPLACVPNLLTPAEGATMDNGRTDHQDKIIWDFDWSDCPGATEYHLYVIHAGAAVPVIDVDAVPGSTFHYESSGYVPPANLTNWQWKVRAKVGGSWKPWSPVRTFEVEPPDTDPCVPTLLTPAEGATMDNGRTDHLNPIIWDFDWADCTGATEYHLYVIHAGAAVPVIDNDAVPGSDYHYESLGYVPSGGLTNWQWKVRAKVGGSWKPWSPIRTFNVEPPNTDPP